MNLSLACMLTISPFCLAIQSEPQAPHAGAKTNVTILVEDLVSWLKEVATRSARPTSSQPSSPNFSSTGASADTAQPPIAPPPPIRPAAEPPVIKKIGITPPAPTPSTAPTFVAPTSSRDNAQASSISHDELEQRIFDAIEKALNEGAEIYNGTSAKPPSPLASALYFKATLQTLEPLLTHRPELQLAVRGDMAKGLRKQNASDQAFALREVLLRIKMEVDPDNIKIGEGFTLWERVGGARNVRKIIDRFIDASLADPAVNFSRGGKYPMTPKQVGDIKRKIFELASAGTGGPDRIYLHKSMKEAHKGMDITDSEFDAMSRQLRIALIASRVRPEDILKIMGVVSIIKAEIVQPPAPAQTKLVADTTLWERLGEAKVTKIVDEFIDAAVKDPRVNFSRNGKFQLTAQQLAAVKRQLVSLTSAVAKGPLRYEGKSMKDIHEGMNITDEEFDALQTQLRVVLGRNQVTPSDISLILLAFGTTRRDIVAPIPR